MLLALVVLAIAATPLSALIPGDSAPGLCLQTLSGRFEVNASTTDQLPLLIYVYQGNDASSRFMWQDAAGVQQFISATPERAHYLMLSYSDDPAGDAHYLQEQVLHNLPKTGQAATALDRMHFAMEPVPQGWLSELLEAWTSPRKVVHTAGSEGFERLDSVYGWLPWPEMVFQGPIPLQLFKEPCHNSAAAAAGCSPGSLPCHSDVAGVVALVLLEQPASKLGVGDGCSFAAMISNAQDRGAAAVIFAAAPGRDIDLINCTSPTECTLPLTIPATMITHKAGQSLQAALLAQGHLQVSFEEQQVQGFYAGIDEKGRLFEMGWTKWPTLMHLAWQAQWQEYLHHLYHNRSRPALEVPVFTKQNLSGPGLTTTLELPAVHTMQSHNILELDFQLGCPGTVDADCPVWDHVVQLFVCCNDSSPACQPCQGTPWAATPDVAGSHSLSQQSNGASVGAPLCGPELGRWITPFRRRIGQWLTDVTPLLPLLSSSKCTFHLQTVSWALTWQPSLTLRFRNSTHAAVAAEGGGDSQLGGDPVSDAGLGLRPEPANSTLGASALRSVAQNVADEWGKGGSSATARRLQKAAISKLHLEPPASYTEPDSKVPHAHSRNTLVALFKGGTFDAFYNSQGREVQLDTPKTYSGALLEAVITGHGSDEFQCAEFCPTSHHFFVNGEEFKLTFSEAGTPWGCANQVLAGSEPNEHGTWQYGRGGWCDGQQVNPWVVDISHSIASIGEMNNISYVGLFEGRTPNPSAAPGYVMMEASLIWCHRHDAVADNKSMLGP